MPVPSPLVREWRPDWPCPVGLVLFTHRRGAGDPTYRRAADGSVWRGIRSPEGPATLHVEPLDADGVVRARAWGAGAQWVLDSLPRMLGGEDDPTGFEPPEVLRDVWRRYAHWRISATGLVMESLVPTIIEQKVTGQEAFAGFRHLVHRFGERAPGPPGEPDPVVRLWVQPSPEQLRRVPSWEWLRLHIDGGRSRPLQRALRVAPSLERAGGETPQEFDRRLRTIPGIGVWTSAEVRARALGDPDAVSFGDYHVAKNLTYALTGEVGDDERMAELLEPWAGHRHRVQRLVELGRVGRPRRG
ncbi:MAG: DNA-3-methyladenine glycosylase 2 family protein, partial [Marmoricola sp.]|nr:DNA-3-methyladenine glycosylase 2 family protein [Marmoricola sp.]